MANLNPAKSDKIKVINAEGSYYEIGHTIGRKTRLQIQQILHSKSYDENQSVIDNEYNDFLKYIEPYPFIVDELRGMADGSGTDFESIVRLNIVELDRERNIQFDCSSFIIKKDNTDILAHSEDGLEGDDIFLLRATYPSGTEILSFCYYGSLVGISASLNSHGFIMSCNLVLSNDNQPGEPKRVFSRRLVECKTIDEALDIVKTARRCQGQHYIFKQFDRTVGVEASATRVQSREIAHNYYHCNNYIFPEMKKYEADAGYVKKLNIRTLEAEGNYQSLSDLKGVKEVLSSHKNHPNCFCTHGSEKGNYSKTLGSIYFDCIKKQIWIGYGPTCRIELECIPFSHPW
ncbi:MAG: hypothetical protein HOC71_06370 [Candidatus Latescibacteria bacterium]|nr:hypothetical protein [Candidatus Latescibacterota bacterium]